MSGSAGGNRITRMSVENTVQDYIQKVLSKFPGFKKAKATGSYNAGTKQDFGDIDLIVQIEGIDKKLIKQDLAKYFSTLPDSLIVPFKSDKYKGKKSLNSGELVTVLYPIAGMSDQYVQIDNIISVSEEESTFKNTFLDYSAEVQGLLLGLAKVICLEEDPQEIFKRLGIKNIPPLELNQEYEFNLSGVGLTLRVVTLDNFKEVDRTDVWKSSNWNTVKRLFDNYNIDSDFKTLLKDLSSKLKNERSKNRIKGIFKSMVSIKSGEVDTPKGNNKQIALDAVDNILENMLFKGLVKELIMPLLEDEFQETIAIYPGKFKPPHKGHFEVAKQLIGKVDKIIIAISAKEHDGITAQQSEAVWKLYNTLLDGKLDIEITKGAPVGYVLDTIEANQNTHYIAVYGKGEEGRYKAVGKDPRYMNAEIFDGGTAEDEEGKIDASNLRIALNKNKNISKFLPKGITPEEYKQALELSLNELEDYEIKYWALHADLYKVLKDNPDKEYKILKNELKGDRLKALNYFYYNYLSKDAPKKINEDKEQKLRIFDFDDTLVHVNATIYITHKDGTEEELTPAEYAVYEPQPGDTSNFREFNAIIKNASPIEKNINLLKQAAFDSNTRVTILTARGLGYPVSKYLKDEFNLDIYIVALGSSDPQKKAEYIEDQIKKGYSDIEFIDDSTKNVNAVNQLKLKYPDIRLNAEIAENKLLENTSFQLLDFKTHLTSLTKYMVDQGMNIKPYPALKIINNDFKNAENMLGKTAYYDPTNCSITLYTLNRHPKDILRSYAHEMIHRMQDNENRLNNVNSTNTNNGGDLEQLEREAYEQGNMCFRNWEDSLKANKYLNEYKKYSLTELFETPQGKGKFIVLKKIKSLELDTENLSLKNSSNQLINFNNKWIIDTPKYNTPQTITSYLSSQLHKLKINEIKLNPNNAVKTYGDLTNGDFSVGEHDYNYIITNLKKNPYNSDSFYSVSFHEIGNKNPNLSLKTGNAGSKNYIKILSTLYKIILDFIEKEKPEYIGISSLEDSGYWTIYNDLTKNNEIPGYFRKTAKLNFTSKDGNKGAFIILKQKNEI